MADRETKAGHKELTEVRRRSRGALVATFVFSVFVNLLMLTSPLYMLQVYDRVLVSRSEATLIALSVLATALFLAMGLIDHARNRVMSRIGARLQSEMEERVLSASFRRLSVAPQDGAAHSAQRDLDAVSRVWTSPALLALFDLPWTPVFAAALFIFHPSWAGRRSAAW
jgi:ATP-binding cassette subfamily C protein